MLSQKVYWGLLMLAFQLSRLAHSWCKGPGILKEFRILSLEKFCLSKVWTTGATSCDPICQGKLHSSMNSLISNNKLSWNIKVEGYFLCRYMAKSCQNWVEDSWWLQYSLDQVCCLILFCPKLLLTSFRKMLSDCGGRSDACTLFTNVFSKENLSKTCLFCPSCRLEGKPTYTVFFTSVVIRYKQLSLP